MNKKVVSLLLSAAMIFTMNAAVFAEGNVTTVDGEVGVETVYKSPIEKELSENKKTEPAIQSNNAAFKEAEKAGVTVKRIPYETGFTGKKINSKDIVAASNEMETESTGHGFEWLYVSANGFAAPVKAVKIKTKGQNVGDTVTWTIKSINNANYVVSMNSVGDWETLTKKEAKEGYKSLKDALKNIKNIEFNTTITTKYYTHVIDAASANAVKKGGWSNEIEKVFEKEIKINESGFSYTAKPGYDNALVVTKKNGTIKKVQTVSFVYDKTTSLYSGTKYSQNGNRGYYVKKLAFKTLKKDKDYTISGNTVVLDKTNYNSVGDLSNFQANW